MKKKKKYKELKTKREKISYDKNHIKCAHKVDIQNERGKRKKRGNLGQ